MGFNNSKLKWLYLVGFFLILSLPVLNVPPWFSPPDWGKTIIFRIVLSVLIFIFLWEILFGRGLSSAKFSGRVKIGLFLLLAFLVINFLATIFSLDRNFSLWGSPYRSGGFLNFAFYIIFAILVFLILQKPDWQKIWDFSIGIGILVSIIAIFQQFGIFSEIFIPAATKLSSTIGGPIFLGIYLLLLSFLTLSLGLRGKNLIKKIFYFISFFVFIFIILLTASQAAYLGFAFGFLYFLFFYPVRKYKKQEKTQEGQISNGIYPKKIVLFKILIGSLIIFGLFGAYFLKTHPEVSLSQNHIIQNLFQWRMDPSRISAWKLSLKALKDKPILGYGPENFSIPFDKYYDPSLPGITRQPGGGIAGWWDRAHNFVFDISLTAGIPALIIYLLLFGVLFWQLQKLKKDSKQAVICHGIQATFLAYFVANFFSFDTFSSYLISFLLVVYSLHLISSANLLEESESGIKNTPRSVLGVLRKYKALIMFLLLILLIWFIWNYNLKPLEINKEVNYGRFVETGETEKREEVLLRIEKVLSSHSFLDNYVRLSYVDVIGQHLKENPEKKLELAQKATKVLKENIKIRPYYTRNWLFLGAYTNYLIEEYQKTQPDIAQDLKKEGDFYFEMTEQLSPERLDLWISWAKLDLITGEYKKAKEKAQKCIELKPDRRECWWWLGLAQIGLGEKEEAKKSIEIAGEMDYPINSRNSLLQLAKMHGLQKDFLELLEIYQKLIKNEPKKFQYHASLAHVYKMLGDYEKAREEAFIVFVLSPESRESVEEFLKSLK